MSNFGLKILYLLIFISNFSHLSIASEGVVSLKPNITELIFELGGGDQLVGVTTFCNYPPEAQKIEKVGDYSHVDVEKVLKIRPKLVVNSQENSIEREIVFLQKRGIKVKLLNFDRLDHFFDSIIELSKEFDREEEAHRILRHIKSALEELRTIDLPPEKVIVVVGIQPLVIVGGNNFLNDLLVYLGITNGVGNSSARYPTWGVEQLILSQPTVIIDLAMGTEKKDEEIRLKWYRRFQSIPAVKNNRIYFLDMNDFRASSRLIRGARKIVEVLQQ